MSFLEILSTLLLKPIQLVFEIIYMITYEVTDNPGISIIVLSLVMNFLLLPLYNRADKIQEEERDVENKLHNGVAHIKKTFHGDERMMILQTYYRQNQYKPTHVLRGGISLCLEIPFFIAAYQFLSNLLLLQGVSFGPIADLGQPDGMLTVGNLTINVLPIVMTLINIISSLLYTKGSPLKTKIQLYIMAAIFLVVLYNSPSGLVFYWTLNNIFSLIKTVINRTKQPKKNLQRIICSAGMLSFLYGLIYCPLSAIKLKVFYCVIGVLLQFPILQHCIVTKKNSNEITEQSNWKLFWISGIFLSLLTGVLIPSAVISASPQEFIGISPFYHPLWYICGALCLAVGTFIVWAGVFYGFMKKKTKFTYEKVMVIISFFALIDYMFFGKHYGLLNPVLQYENGFDVSWKEQLVNLIVLGLVAVVLIFLIKKWKKGVFQVLLVGSITLICMSVINIVSISNSVKSIREELCVDQNEDIRFKLSKNAKNVVVIMLDRAYNGYIPFFLNEKPELKELFDGFTYYSNVISFGGHTNFGAPALYGGYEYTPLEINKRDDETLVSKHNEALKVMPAVFGENGYEVTVADSPYANYQSIPDPSIYDGMTNVKAYVTEGAFSDDKIKKRTIVNNQRNFFCYSLLKAIPSIAQETLYQNGTYRQSNATEEASAGQYIFNNFIAEGINPGFVNPYNVLHALPSITDVEDCKTGQFILMDNNTAHNQALLQEPAYVPVQNVDNTEYERENGDRYSLNGHVLHMDSSLQYEMYQSNMAALLQLGRWFDYLREKDVYDNTKIIIVADHGFTFGLLDDLIYGENEDYNWYYPLLMVKDFNSTGFHTSDQFMTNGDVPTLATKDVIENPVNPFTGKKINAEAKNEEHQYIIGSHDWETDKNNGNVFLPSVWYSVHDNIWDKDNWKVIENESELP